MNRKYKNGDLVSVLINPERFDKNTMTYDKKETGIIVGSHEISVYDCMSNGRSRTSFSYAVMVNSDIKSFFEEEIDIMQLSVE
ncbi:hypothetical protein CMI47_19120 [Candidatus Pacearchaeota archaeon]|nr:hypothetical protein [Candidatus Pacearchaeota archaeon]|tara:strand:- start:409 stop:657 length:249 start_codon:yes stop_codon:yes gene_type:complete